MDQMFVLHILTWTVVQGKSVLKKNVASIVGLATTFKFVVKLYL